MKNSLYLFLSLILVSSCGEKVSFEEPQPAHLEALDQIPSEYWGKYFNEDDSSVVEINGNRILETVSFELESSLEEILTEIAEEDDVDILVQTDSELTIKIPEVAVQTFVIKNDSIFGTVRLPDILFSLDNHDIVKREKNHDYFNVVNKSGQYYLRQVSFQNDFLVISKINKALDIKDLLSLDNEAKFTGKRLKPTKRQFNRIARKSFSVEKKLKRVE